MKVRHLSVLLLVVLHGTMGQGWQGYQTAQCNYDCHSDGSCSLQVSTFLTDPIEAQIPRCMPCNSVCQVRDGGIVGGVNWQMFSKIEIQVDLDDQPSNKN